MRFYAAIDNGVVVGTRATTRRYPYAVLHRGGAAGTFATFHLTKTHAQIHGVEAFRRTAPYKVVVRTVETSTRLPLGANLSVGAVLQP